MLTFPSEFAHDLHRRSGVEATGRVWANGVTMPEARFFQLQCARRKSDNRLTFGFLGGPSHIKGWPLMLQAFKALQRSDFRVFLVDGAIEGSWWLGRDLSGLPGEWVVHPRFTQRSIDDFYAKIDVLLFPSQWKETFGLTIREANSRGVKVIQTDSGGASEHMAVESDRLLRIGGSPNELIIEIQRTLEEHPDFPQPLNERSYYEQADELNEWVKNILT